jgi:hypothetical protein
MFIVWLHSALGMLPSNLESIRGRGWLVTLAGIAGTVVTRLWWGAGPSLAISTSWFSGGAVPFCVVMWHGVGEAGGEGVASSVKGGIGVGSTKLASEGVYGTIGWMFARSTAAARTRIDVILHLTIGGAAAILSGLSAALLVGGSGGGVSGALGWWHCLYL